MMRAITHQVAATKHDNAQHQRDDHDATAARAVLATSTRTAALIRPRAVPGPLAVTVALLGQVAVIEAFVRTLMIGTRVSFELRIRLDLSWRPFKRAHLVRGRVSRLLPVARRGVADRFRRMSRGLPLVANSRRVAVLVLAGIRRGTVARASPANTAMTRGLVVTRLWDTAIMRAGTLIVHGGIVGLIVGLIIRLLILKVVKRRRGVVSAAVLLLMFPTRAVLVRRLVLQFRLLRPRVRIRLLLRRILLLRVRPAMP